MSGLGDRPGAGDERVALSAAAAIALHRLLPEDAKKPYDGAHLSEMLDVVADALVRLVTVYVQDGVDTPVRTLENRELIGARILRGATVLELAGGARHYRVSLRKREMRDAIAILKRAGLPAPGASGVTPPAPAGPEKLAK